jgi:hypothetical protein
MLAGSTVCCGDFVGIGPAFRCSVVTDATGAPRAVLVGLITYEAAKNLSKICKPQVICSNQIAGIYPDDLQAFSHTNVGNASRLTLTWHSSTRRNDASASSHELAGHNGLWP